MPKLSELTDAYTPQETLDSLPVESPFTSVPADPDGVRRVRIDTVAPKQEAAEPGIFSQNADKFINALFRDDDKRYQLWPERMVREGLSAAGDVMSGKVPQWAVDPETGDVHTSPNMVEKAQEMSALAGTGGLAGMTTDATLGATPFLRPALKYKDKLYKGKDGQQHMDVIPASIYPEFQRQAMSGEDISNFQFGFVNEKGHFLDREKALKHAIDTGLVDPQAAQYGALTAPVLERMQNNGSMSVYPDKGFSGGGLNNILTTQLLADSSKPGIAIEAMKKAQPFFSAVEHNVNAIPQAKMTGDQWLGTLSNKPGVKPEEMQWTGLQDFLMENKGKPVTKEQIVEHLNNNKVELKEVQKGEGTVFKQNYPTKDELLKQAEGDDMLFKSDGSLQKHLEVKQFHDGTWNIVVKNEPDTKYHGYQLPGGENYREMLLTLPEVKRANSFDNYLSAYRKRFPNADSTDVEVRGFYDKGVQVPGEGKLTSKTDPDVYKSSHWDEPNILAHVRMNDRTIDGKKSLHLEEIQSDWGQTIRDKGHALTAAEKKRWEAVKQKADKDLTPQDLKDIDDLGRRAVINGLPPDMPFKKTWHELALKRMLREAAEKGYDRLSWTPGEAQAARYDLSKQVDNLLYKKNDDGTFKVSAQMQGRGQMLGEKLTESQLADQVGKEMAQKIAKGVGKSENLGGGGTSQKDLWTKLEGENLKIGGEGMKGFYDKMIPQAIEKLGKEHGVKVKRGEAPTGFKKGDGSNQYGAERGDDGKFYVIDRDRNRIGPALNTRQEAQSAMTELMKDRMRETAPVHYIDIPQSLKDQAMHKGFPLFSAGGHMLIPVDHDPFKKDETK